MLILQDFSISPDGRFLVIDVNITPSLVEGGVYIKNIMVCCDGSFDMNESSTKFFENIIKGHTADGAVEGEYIEGAENEYTGTMEHFEGNGNDTTENKVHPTALRYTIDLDGTGLSKKPYYLWVQAEDPYHVTSACVSNSVLTAFTFNKYPLYQKMTCMAREFDGCDIPIHFIDYLMRLKALESSIATGDTESINYYYEWLMLNNAGNQYAPRIAASRPKQSRGCGCH